VNDVAYCSLRLPRLLVEQARELGERTGLTRSQVVSVALDDYLLRHGRPLRRESAHLGPVHDAAATEPDKEAECTVLNQ
jgi:hypothetical protein